VQGQINLRDAVTREISFANPDGKQYRLNPQIATLLVRPRGWHLYEKHLLLDGKPIPARSSTSVSICFTTTQR
jgi:malate synthase